MLFSSWRNSIAILLVIQAVEKCVLEIGGVHLWVWRNGISMWNNGERYKMSNCIFQLWLWYERSSMDLTTRGKLELIQQFCGRLNSNWWPFELSYSWKDYKEMLHTFIFRRKNYVTVSEDIYFISVQEANLHFIIEE